MEHYTLVMPALVCRTMLNGERCLLSTVYNNKNSSALIPSALTTPPKNYQHVSETPHPKKKTFKRDTYLSLTTDPEYREDGSLYIPCVTDQNLTERRKI